MTSKRTDKEIEPASGLWGNLEASIKAAGVAIQRVRKQIASEEFEAAAESASAVRIGLEKLMQLKDEVEQTERDFKTRAEKQFSELENFLRMALSQRGWKLDGTWPSLYVERAIPIEIEEKNRVVKVSGRRVRTATVKDIMSALAPSVTTLLSKNFAPKSFMDQLAKAYDVIKGSNAQVPALQVYRGLVMALQPPQFWKDARREGFQELSMDQFRARVTRCLEAGCTSTSDRRELRMLPPLDPKDGIFVYQPAELRFAFVGRIEFVQT